MTSLKQLEEKVRELEKRIEELEQVNDDPLYEDAKRLVKKHQKASVIFLQRHLLIDFDRAEKLLIRLGTEGIISNRD